jgi:uncharacterized Zn finger protein
MKLLKCKLCSGEVDIVGNEKTINKKVKCRKCGFTNSSTESEQKFPEVLVIRKRKVNAQN